MARKCTILGIAEVYAVQFLIYSFSGNTSSEVDDTGNHHPLQHGVQGKAVHFLAGKGGLARRLALELLQWKSQLPFHPPWLGPRVRTSAVATLMFSKYTSKPWPYVLIMHIVK